ncbi:MAG: UDP-4-amino-4,6-dideoxy-N-acetyl-beta-L-altrosamine transaminase [Bacteroidetes bacterium]|nr:UDP-4-amino-4,6-dideoxy-N-acetyl-beta-L-altrosamine transaminase [Bacteroidota bacterium]
MIDKIPYGKQDITSEDLQAVTSVLTGEFLTQGPAVSIFENEFAAYVGAKYAVAVSNGTTALHLCTLALNVNKDTNVITTPITFAASANCVRYCGGSVYFADIDKDSFVLDIAKTEELILSKPAGFFSGIIPVDFAGFAANMEAFRELANRYNLWIIEDACHSPGGFFIDKKGLKQYCGSAGLTEFCVFSFHPVKHIACGEGGMITTNDETLYKKLLLLRTHGITRDPSLLEHNEGGWWYEMQELGYNYRITDFQAALGSSQLKRAELGLARRREIAERYQSAFMNKPYILGQSGVVEGHAYHLYVIRIEKRKELYDYLKQKNIYCQVHYIPVHTMPYYKRLSGEKVSMPVAEQYYSECLSLPMYPTLTNEQQDYVIREIDLFFNSL